MSSAIIAFLAIVLTALALAPGAAHALALPFRHHRDRRHFTAAIAMWLGVKREDLVKMASPKEGSDPNDPNAGAVV